MSLIKVNILRIKKNLIKVIMINEVKNDSERKFKDQNSLASARKAMNYLDSKLKCKLTILSTKRILATFTSAIDGASNTTLYIKTTMSELAYNDNGNTRQTIRQKT